MTDDIDDMPYRFDEYYIPARMMRVLLRYIEHGIEHGSFLTAVLCNDLRAAAGQADYENLRNLPAYVSYLYNEAPAGCWGSPENVSAWIAYKTAADGGAA